MKKLIIFCALIFASCGFNRRPVVLAGIVLADSANGGVTDTVSDITLTSIAGGTDIFYVLSVTKRNNVNISSVTGGGLTWTLRKAQCGGRGQTSVHTYTAFGSPSAFQAVVSFDISNGAGASAILASFSGVDSSTPFEDAVGENTLGENGACSGGTDDDVAQLTTGSMNANSVHYLAICIRNDTITRDSDYTQIEYVDSGALIDMYAYFYLKSATGDDTFNDAASANISGNEDWSAAGFVIIPAAAPPAGSPKRGQVIVIGDE